jgi:hypothetical protein
LFGITSDPTADDAPGTEVPTGGVWACATSAGVLAELGHCPKPRDAGDVLVLYDGSESIQT